MNQMTKKILIGDVSYDVDGNLEVFDGNFFISVDTIDNVIYNIESGFSDYSKAKIRKPGGDAYDADR